MVLKTPHSHMIKTPHCHISNKKVYTELCYYMENSILVAMATTLDDEPHCHIMKPELVSKPPNARLFIHLSFLKD